MNKIDYGNFKLIHQKLISKARFSETHSTLKIAYLSLFLFLNSFKAYIYVNNLMRIKMKVGGEEGERRGKLQICCFLHITLMGDKRKKSNKKVMNGNGKRRTLMRYRLKPLSSSFEMKACVILRFFIVSEFKADCSIAYTLSFLSFLNIFFFFMRKSTHKHNFHTFLMLTISIFSQTQT